MRIVSSFRDLDVYKLARVAAHELFVATTNFPKYEQYALTDQVRRSSRATKALIAEAWGRRRYRSVFVNKLDEALGESNETQSWLDDSFDCQYITGEQHSKMVEDWCSVSAMVSRMIDRASDFCRYDSDEDYRSITREDPDDYEG